MPLIFDTMSTIQNDLRENDETQAAMGERLRILRESLGLSPTQMADRAGIDRTSWGRFESGKRPITYDNLFRLVRYADVTTDYVLRGSLVGLPGETRDRILSFLRK